MSSLPSSNGQTPDGSDNSDAAIDPLVEQMSTFLHLANRPRAAAEQASRPRRFSDADRPAGGASSKPEPIAVVSRDGSRWLPTPDEQSHKYATQNPATETDADLDPLSSAARPLAPHECDSAVCSVAKVFATTELLELIIGMLSTRDILASRRTNKHWGDTVKASPDLRLHFYYYPQLARPASDFKLLPLSLPGLSIELGGPLHLGQWIQVSLTADAARKIAPEPRPSRRVRSRSIFEGLRGGLGTKGSSSDSSDSWPKEKTPEPTTAGLQYEDLFITQPPVVGMQAFIITPSASSGVSDGHGNGDGDDDKAPAAVAKISCDAGITLGFLAETVQSYLATRKSTEGDVRMQFKAIMSFTSNTDAAPRRRGNARTVTRI